MFHQVPTPNSLKIKAKISFTGANDRSGRRADNQIIIIILASPVGMYLPQTFLYKNNCLRTQFK